MSSLFPFFWKTGEFAIYIQFAMLISIVCGAMAFTSTLLMNGLERALFSGLEKSRFKAGLLVVASCFAPVLLYLSFVSAATKLVSDDDKALDLANIWSIVSASVLFTSIVFWFAWQLSSDNRNREEWAKLQID
jgi:hypothetical protein